MLLDNAKTDDRPKRGGWAPGGYYHAECRVCGATFIGDKRAWMCADCGYADDEAQNMTDEYLEAEADADFDRLMRDHKQLHAEIEVLHELLRMAQSDLDSIAKIIEAHKEAGDAWALHDAADAIWLLTQEPAALSEERMSKRPKQI